MATPTWKPAAQDIAQVEDVTIGGTIAASNTFTITINNKNITFTATTTTISHVVAALVAAWNASTIPEIAEITATDASPDVRLTHDTAGVPFTVTVSKTGAGNTISTSTTTSATGKNFYDNIDNWDTGAVPGASDNAHVDNTDISILYGLSNAGATLASFNVGANFTGEIGLPNLNANGYIEYRTQELAIDATVVKIGHGNGQGSGRIRLNLGTVQSAIEIVTTAASVESDVEAVQIRGTNASNTLEVRNGSVGIAAIGGQSATIKTVLVTGGTVRFGDGVTLSGAGSSLQVSGGLVEVNSAMLTATIDGGTCRFNGSGAVTTLTVNPGATMHYNSSGTAATVVIRGTLSCTEDLSARTFTTTTLGAGGFIDDPANTITPTNGYVVDATVSQISAT